MWIAIFIGCKNNENTFAKIYGINQMVYILKGIPKRQIYLPKSHLTLTLFIMLEPAARHSAPNQSCPPRLSVTISSGNFCRNSLVARPPAPSNSSSILEFKMFNISSLDLVHIRCLVIVFGPLCKVLKRWFEYIQMDRPWYRLPRIWLNICFRNHGHTKQFVIWWSDICKDGPR